MRKHDVSSLRCALLILALGLTSAAAADSDWADAYRRGLHASAAENYPEAIEEFRHAIAGRPMEFIDEQHPINGIPIYLPHSFLGAAKLRFGDAEGALAEFKISEQQGVVAQHANYAEQQSRWKVWAIARIKAASAIRLATEAQRRAIAASADRTETYRKAVRALEQATYAYEKKTGDEGSYVELYRHAFEYASEASNLFNAGIAETRTTARPVDRTSEVRVPPRPTPGWIVLVSVLAGIVVVALVVLIALGRRRTRPAVDDTVRDAHSTLRTPVAPSSDPTQFREGQVISERYRIVRLLGQGGMGAVYAAEDGEFGGELVALKTILAPGKNASRLLARFKKEVQLARRVAHPNVCRIFDVGYHVAGPGRSIFVSMEYIAGVPLKTVIQQKGRLNEREALEIIRDVAAALEATHAAGLIHRDVKSANVMIAEDDRAVLMDFGLACLSNPDADEPSLTKTGAIVGTPAYMAPEQIEGTALTPATDIYAFGMVIYEMVTGRLPYEGDTPMYILAKRLREPPRSPAHFVPNLKAEWEHTILRCLEHDPAKRFQNAMDVCRALDREADAPTLRM